MRHHEKLCHALVIPSPSQLILLPVNRFPNKLAPNVPNVM